MCTYRQKYGVQVDFVDPEILFADVHCIDTINHPYSSFLYFENTIYFRLFSTSEDNAVAQYRLKHIEVCDNSDTHGHPRLERK